MSLPSGTRIGPYEVIAQIGVGGMGEVYRATDTNLKRAVAIKVLPEAMAADADRLARFQREAEVLAALNHPNIAAIYGLERSGSSTALVMELVEGPTLADRIAQGVEARRGGSSDPPVPIDETLAIAKQIAEALEAAHEQGIIHRDLKPANIKVRPDGAVKVLDFGLAKSMEPAGAMSPSVSQSPTITTPAMTQMGMILGTAAYMSPEQAKGRPADKRSDVWAFGAVLYEMLTGKRAFDGDDIVDVLGAVARLEPDWAALPADCSTAIRTLLRRCLEKDRRKRISDVSAALFVLDEASSLATSTEAQARVSAGSAALIGKRSAVALGAAAAVAGAVMAGAAVWFTVRPEPAAVVWTALPTAGEAALSLNGVDRDIAITPDGRRIVYRGSNGRLLVRALAEPRPVVLDGLGAPRAPFISPDGQWIGFLDGLTIRRVAFTGGSPVTVATTDGNSRGATWGGDGTIVFATAAGGTGLQRVAVTGGDPMVLTRPDRSRGEADHLWPEFLPDRRAVLFTIAPASGELDEAMVAVLDLDTNEQTVLIRGGHHAQYVPTGHLVYGVQGTLRAVRFDVSRLEVVGATVPVLEDVFTTGQGAVNAVLAANGTLVLVSGARAAGAERSLVWVDRAGTEEGVKVPPRAFRSVRISPDGKRAALDITERNNDIWILEFATNAISRLTFSADSDEFPVWTPDGRGIVFSSGPQSVGNIYWQASDGTGQPRRLTEAAVDQDAYGVTPDGRSVIIQEENDPPTGNDIMMVNLAPGDRSTSTPGGRGAVLPSPRPLLRTDFRERNAEASPDGRWLAYESNESGRDEIYVRPLPDVNGGRWQVSSGGGLWPAWSKAGDELFFMTTASALMGVRVQPGGTFRSSAPSALFQGAYYAPAGNNRSFDIAPDGRRFLMIRETVPNEGGSPRSIMVVQNWGEELQRLVPRP